MNKQVIKILERVKKQIMKEPELDDQDHPGIIGTCEENMRLKEALRIAEEALRTCEMSVHTFGDYVFDAELVEYALSKIKELKGKSEDDNNSEI